ncbi:MAG TPA: hypothetical protein VGX28_03105 [Frankiaceae bacterium]|jgi:hypothetical protein|nr:hypothetical protein [Frankiaceae bacterium]
MTRPAAATALALLLAASACGGYDHLLGDPSATPTGSATSTAPSATGGAGDGATVRYALRIRDGGTTRATVAYLLPSGERREETVAVPWSSADLAFPAGATLFVTASTTDALSSPLLCVLQGARAADGAYVNGRVTKPTASAPQGQLSACATEYVLGAWPPPEDDPETGNLLIRVG